MNPEAGQDLYRQLDDHVNDAIGIDIGYTMLVAPRPYPMDAEQVAGFKERYSVIKEFQEQTIALFRASLNDREDPLVARTVLGELPDRLGIEHHRLLDEQQLKTPVFFRTDEVIPGKLSEIQCCGSGWGNAEQLWRLYRNNEDVFGPPRHFPESLATRFAGALGRYLGDEGRVHHLVDNASLPFGIRYFIQRTRAHGVRYFGYDKGVGPTDCNFVRSHDFFCLAHHNFFANRLQACSDGSLWFDLPPSVLFDCKAILAWPFWEKTRHWYSDEVRRILPFTSIIEPEGFVLEEGGSRTTIDQFAELPRRGREFYVKYAGPDIALNWGSKAVFNTGSLSRVEQRDLFERVNADYLENRFWIVQQGHRNKEKALSLQRDGSVTEAKSYTKMSGFYGPDGLMALWALQKDFHKVHGSANTTASLVH